MPPELQRFITQCRERIEPLLDAALPPSMPETRLTAAMRYSLLNGGKRIRPMLVYSAAAATGGINEGTDAFACAVEMIHTYSLIHDDLPAMDDDDLRRGQATCHIAFDEATAILAGDALQSLAFSMVAEQTQLSPHAALEGLRILARASGKDGMVLGQSIDLEAVGLHLSLEQLQTTHRCKTGALIDASVQVGALSSGASLADQRALSDFAQAIGLAFQIQDDIIDVISDTQTLGKNQGSDKEQNKPTYVSLLGLDGAQRKASQLVEESYTAIGHMGPQADYLRQLADYIVQRKH